MPKSYVLIDYENVQPSSFAQLKHPDFHIIVFLGANQKNLATGIVTALQPFGSNARYVQISGNGKNAADFHIAYYAGRLIAQDSASNCYIVSKDKGFDPLVKHLKSNGATAKRVADFNKIPVLEGYAGKTVDGKVDKIIANLESRGKAIPKKKSGLCNLINSLFGTPLKDAELANILGRMKNLGVLSIENESVSFNFK